MAQFYFAITIMKQSNTKRKSGAKTPLSFYSIYTAFWCCRKKHIGAGNEIRTRDPQLGKRFKILLPNLSKSLQSMLLLAYIRIGTYPDLAVF
ncbi:MAG: hypothetical protein DKM50_04350 [Candidatus Margulisiibacteriota bacterium]|nr:MAG: hypothetical protein DKM50_04350 [Candidatus Margulisiibacteriota bacterium]